MRPSHKKQTAIPGVVQELPATRRPHLSTSWPHLVQVHPPHIACLSEVGLRTTGARVPQPGQVTRRRFRPKLFLRTVPHARITPAVTSPTTRMMSRYASGIFWDLLATRSDCPAHPTAPTSAS